MQNTETLEHIPNLSDMSQTTGRKFQLAAQIAELTSALDTVNRTIIHLEKKQTKTEEMLLMIQLTMEKI